MRIGAALVLMVGAMMAGGEAGAEARHKGYEMPPYRVERQEGAREIRDYGRHVLAEVQVRGSREAAIGTGFSVLAGYIFGANATGERIAMTVPVAQSATGGVAETPEEAVWTISFMIPARLAAEGLPAARNSAIRFVQAGPSRQVVERFAGRPESADLAARAEALRDWAEAQGLKIAAGPHYYFYDAPMTPAAQRRNEVAFTLR